MKSSFKILSVIFILVFVFSFTACSEQSGTETSISEQSKVISDNDIDIDDSNAPNSSDEEILSGTVIEEIGNEKITREYRDGKNDYTETVERFYDDGSLREKEVIDYLNGNPTKRTTLKNKEDGTYELYVDEYDENGIVVNTTYESKNGIYRRVLKYGSGEEETFDLEYYDDEDVLIAKGTVGEETKDDTDIVCRVERVKVFEGKEIKYSQLYAYSESDNYSCMALFDLDGEVLYSKEDYNKTETIFIAGENSFVVVSANGTSTYAKPNGDVIVVVKDNLISTVGSEYTNMTDEELVNMVNEMYSSIMEAQKYIVY